MLQTIEPTEISLDAYTMCSFLPNLDSARAIPLVLIGYRQSEDPWFVWLVPKDGVIPSASPTIRTTLRCCAIRKPTFRRSWESTSRKRAA